jgi:hypothetical protein
MCFFALHIDNDLKNCAIAYFRKSKATGVNINFKPKA